nr:paramyosin-like [Megalopta genalis]
MENRQTDDRLLTDDNDYPSKENSRIAEVAANTLCKLNSIIKQLKSREDDRVTLKSNIWQLRLALRVAGKETDDVLHADPLIEHQRTTIKRLKGVNQTLKKEIAELKSTLNEDEQLAADFADVKSDDEIKQQLDVDTGRVNEEIVCLRGRLKEIEDGQERGSDVEHLECRLKHLTMVDHTVETVFIDIVNRVAEVIADLYEELATVSEHLQLSKLKNEDLRDEVDRLRAMLRSKCDDSLEDHRNRIVELDNLATHLKMELRVCKANFGIESWNMTNNDQCNLRNAERLATELMNKLRNDYEALLATGDPNCLQYIKRIVELRVDLKHLHVALTKPAWYSDKGTEYERYLQHLSTLDVNLEQVCVEIDRFKADHAAKRCKLGETGGLEYLKKVEGLRSIVERAKLMISRLTRGTAGPSSEAENVEELEDLVERMCREIKQLETMVASRDGPSLFKRIEHLEESIVRLKVQLDEKNERAELIKRKLFDAEGSLEKRTVELKDMQRTVAALTEENKILKAKARKAEDRAAKLQRELENDKKEIEQLRQVTNQANVMRTKLRNLRTDKEGLFKELGRLRDCLQKKNDEIKLIASEKDAMGKALHAKAADIGKSQAASKFLNDLKLAESKNAEDGVQLQRLREELEASLESLNNANLRIVGLKDDKIKLEESIRYLESTETMLARQLELEKAAAAQKAMEQMKLTSDYNELKNEKNQLTMQLAGLKTEKELLEKSLENLRAKHSEVEGELGEYKHQCNVLREEIRKFKVSTDDLASRLGDAQAELNGAGDKIKRLECENSRHCNSLLALTLKNTDFEGRVQVLLAEKDELATRINEHAAENGRLNDQLNKAQTENEYSSVELNKLRAERDKAGSENASLRNTLDETRNGNETLRRTVEELKMKLSDARSERRVVENQLRIFELMNAALKKDKETLYREYVGCLRSEHSKPEKECAESEKGDSKVRKDKPGKRSNEIEKAKDRNRELIAENKALKFELSNLKGKNYEMKMKLNHPRDDEFRRQELGLMQSETDNAALRPVMNLYYNEINSYSSRSFSNPVGTVACFDRASVCYREEITDRNSGTEIERLLDLMNKTKIENVALKMELYNLRCNFVANFSEDGKRYRELHDALEETRALKTELTKLRDEKESLQIRLEASETKLHRLKSEKIALKDELYALRNMNAGLKRKANELQYNYQKFTERSRDFECCIMEALTKTKTRAASTADIAGDELKGFLEKLISNETFLQSIEVQGNFDESRFADVATV